MDLNSIEDYREKHKYDWLLDYVKKKKEKLNEK
jgi:hypothetical protein